jgi:hypothetical protein
VAVTTVVVSGALANKPGNGGEAWVRLSWVVGLRRLGFDVCFVEQIALDACIDAAGGRVPAQDSVNAAYFREVTARFGLGGSSALIGGDGAVVTGMTESDLLACAETAALLVNISGHLRHAPLLRRFRRTAFVDIDPGFTQFWHADGTAPLDDHDVYLTIGENIGRPDCAIPTGGIRWRPVRQPVVLDDWPVSSHGRPDRFTTVATWRGPFGPVTAGGRTYGLKVHEFRKVVALPQQAPARFEIALDIHPADGHDRRLLEDHGWRLVDPKQVAADPGAFRSYVQTSGAEFSVAQGIYVDTAGGWFSDRTVRYLASGKPALVQDTGFGRTLPVGEGLVAFTTLEEAAAGAEEIAGDYERHSRAARALAETYFDSDLVLARLVEDIGVEP